VTNVVTNAGGGSSPSSTFLITAVSGAISALAPDHVTAGAPAITLSVTGSGFAPQSKVRWNAAPLVTTYLDPTHLTALLPAEKIANSGEAAISVLNPDSSASAPVAFPIVPLTLSGLDRSNIAAGSASFAIGIAGTGFLPGATAYWDDAALATTFAGSQSLVATIPASRVAAVGHARIAVAIPGGALSNQREFVVSAGGATGDRVSLTGVFNAAGGQAAVAPGSLISIYGTGLAAGSAQGTVPLSSSLGGTVARINGIAIPLLFVSPSQINAQVPLEVLPGAATLVVEVNGAISLPVAVDVRAVAPGVFTLPSGDHAVAVNASDWTFNSAANPARPGDYLILYLTGQGTVDNVVPNGSGTPAAPVSKPLAPVRVTIGGEPATVAFAGLAPGLVSVTQINLLVPAAAPGERALTVTVGDTPANATVVSIAAR
jgi:uncharacterized protein (TIGR03437 family)